MVVRFGETVAEVEDDGNVITYISPNGDNEWLKAYAKVNGHTFFFRHGWRKQGRGNIKSGTFDIIKDLENTFSMFIQ